jgi:hypothetical protein
MVVQRSRALVKTACMPRVRESEPLKIEVVTELVAQSAEEGSERSDLFPHRGTRPHPDQHAVGSVVPKKLGYRVFAHSQRSGCKYSDAAGLDSVELRCGRQKVSTSASDNRSCSVCHRQFDGFCEEKQTPVLRLVERPIRAPEPTRSHWKGAPSFSIPTPNACGRFW